MPGFEFDTPEDAPLFEEPFTITVPGAGTFGLLHYPQTIDDEDLMPISGRVKILTAQVVPDDREAFQKAVESALYETPPRMTMEQIDKALEWIGTEREAAKKRGIGTAAKRPTGGRSRSRAS